MPSIVHTNTALQSASGVALVSQSLSEEVTGLVRVSLEFVCTATKAASVDRLFYPDAAPPVWPSSIQRDTLLARNLFMSERQVETANGLVHVRASYAGGILRCKNYVYKTQERESPRSVSFVSDTYSISFTNPDNPSISTTYIELNKTYSYTWTPIVRSFQFVRIGNKTTGTFNAPTASDLYILASYSSQLYRLKFDGIETYSYPQSFFDDLITNQTIKRDEKTEYASPSVEVVTVRYYL